ncbi:sigma-70 family RNA polymerase sigma factor [Oryzobacter terrae]|uniref:sigma-70 family RNA polymerase sigma factor n=1 Tax=Oryzobacter terrae TaxID=1620385 RepID=UPI00366FEE1A
MAPHPAQITPHFQNLTDRLDVAARHMAEQAEGTASEAERQRLRHQLMVEAIPLADRVALRYRNRGIETDDLIQVARAALVKAVNRYQPRDDAGFCAFALPTISGEVKRWFRDRGWAVRPPRRIQELRSSMRAEEELFRHLEHREPTTADVASSLGTTREDVQLARLSAEGFHAVSLDVPTETGTTLGATLSDGADVADLVATRSALLHALSHLSERQRRVVQLRYVSDLTQSEIGAEIGVSQMQVSRILGKVLDELRRELVVADLDDRQTSRPRQPAA